MLASPSSPRGHQAKQPCIALKTCTPLVSTSGVSGQAQRLTGSICPCHTRVWDFLVLFRDWSFTMVKEQNEFALNRPCDSQLDISSFCAEFEHALICGIHTCTCSHPDSKLTQTNSVKSTHPSTVMCMYKQDKPTHPFVVHTHCQSHWQQSTLIKHGEAQTS